MIIWGLWGAEIFSLFATFLSVDIMAAQTVCNSLMLMFTMVGIGIVQSTTIIVGNMVGLRKIKAALLYGKVAIFASGLWGFITCSVLLIFKDLLIGVYNQSETVNKLIGQALILITINIMIDCIMRAAQGIINGMGRQHKASYVTFLSFWGVGIPSVAFFVFYLDLGI